MKFDLKNNFKKLSLIFVIAFALRYLIFISINNFYSYGGMSGFYGNTAFNILNYHKILITANVAFKLLLKEIHHFFCRIQQANQLN